MRGQNVCLVNWWKTGMIRESKTTKEMKRILIKTST